MSWVRLDTYKTKTSNSFSSITCLHVIRMVAFFSCAWTVEYTRSMVRFPYNPLLDCMLWIWILRTLYCTRTLHISLYIYRDSEGFGIHQNYGKYLLMEFDGHCQLLSGVVHLGKHHLYAK